MVGEIDMGFDSNFLGLGDELPPPPQTPAGLNFVPWKRVGNLLFLAGHGPQWGPEFRFVGKVGRDLDIKDGYAAARLTAINLLQTVRTALGTLDKVSQIVEVFGMVNSAADFTDQPMVINGCSDCLIQIFGDAGKHARTAVGVGELPFGLSVEIKMVVEVSDGQS